MVSFTDYLGRGKVKDILQFRVKKNCDLLEAITDTIKEEGIRSAVIISGIGALRKAVCRNLKWFPKEYPVRDSDRIFYQLEQPLELLALSGWVARREDGEPEIHAHFSVSTVEGEKIENMGGHLTKGTITGFKVVITLLILEEDNFYADFDPTTKTYDFFC